MCLSSRFVTSYALCAKAESWAEILSGPELGFRVFGGVGFDCLCLFSNRRRKRQETTVASGRQNGKCSLPQQLR